ncbi:PIN-like domain-containing protein [Salinicoccus carnicancri]|uniref:PIN-like domain-containing protein n=1 Tax=Salinicoccus carnicancri TaxID=558170 RepID=UPI0002E8C68F|nr:PIN-like domain-containing protein [Salinicoccus carnicancri]
MLEQFKGFIKYTKKEYEDLLDESIIVVDTNILLYFYKYPSKQSAGRLLEILQKFKEKNRLWIPHQVALEYFFNYEDNMYNQKEGYEKIEKNLKGLIDEAKSFLQNAQDDNPFIRTEDFNFFIKNLDESNKELEEKVEEEINDLPNSNEIHDRILELLNNNVGESYNQDEINKIEEDGRERYPLKVPPGFKDKTDKKEYRSYDGIKYQLQYGDLIVWKQIIDKVKACENAKPVIFITEDNKEDWWHIKKGETKGPHPNLIQEFFNETGQNFHMYKTVRFIEYASKYLGIDFNATQLSEVSAELESIRTAEETKADNKKIVKNKAYKNLDNINYRNIIDKSNISLKEILEFLPINEREQSKVLIKNALHANNDEIYHYNEAVLQIIDRVMPYLELTAKDLSADIAIEGYVDLANKFLEKLNSLPEDIVKRAIILLELINEMEIYYKNNGLPF